MKKNIFKVIIALIFLVLFNLLFFLIGGTQQSDVNWTCYGFIHVAYLCILITPLLSKSKKGLEVISYSLYLRATFYFFTELVVGVLCMVIAPESITWPLIIQSVLLAIFLILQFMSALANDATAQSIEKQKEESIYIKDLAQRIKNSMRYISDADTKKQVVRCYDLVNNSPIESFSQAIDAELRLRNAIETLCNAIETGNYQDFGTKIKGVEYAVQDRNTIIKRCRFN